MPMPESNAVYKLAEPYSLLCVPGRDRAGAVEPWPALIARLGLRYRRAARVSGRLAAPEPVTGLGTGAGSAAARSRPAGAQSPP